MNQKWNNDNCRCEYKYPKENYVCKKDYIWNNATCNCENGKYLASIVENSVITCDQIIEATKTVLTKTVLAKTTLTNLYILLTFLSITIGLLIAVSI